MIMKKKTKSNHLIKGCKNQIVNTLEEKLSIDLERILSKKLKEKLRQLLKYHRLTVSLNKNSKMRKRKLIILTNNRDRYFP